ncbi:MAG: O-antigen translocase [Pseudorhodobacter sp.]|nr:O-antigen translocase [Pseudorhodobacter sp.]
MTQARSYHTILRSSSIMAAASVINVLTGLVRMKVAAVLLGPAGVGLYGIYLNLVATAATVAALGSGAVGTRQIADARVNGTTDDIGAARRALVWGTLALAALGGVVFLVLRHQIARVLIADPLRAGEVGWLALGVAITVLAGSQTAILNGLRRTGDLARLQVASGMIATVLGVTALLLWREGGLVVLVLAGPVASFGLGHWYVARLSRITSGPTPLHILAGQWRVMVVLGSAFMVGALVTGLGQLAVRTLVQRDLGPAALGQFQAAWTIGTTYLTFVLAAMTTDYYPRLAACITDRQAACRLINEQTEVALLLAGPVIIALIALAPWVIRLLYTSEFMPAVDILRWQLLGDTLKLLSWPLGFVLSAAGAGKTLVATESVAASVFVLGVALAIPALGVLATGVAYLAMFVVYLPLVFWLARRRLAFAWTRAVKTRAALLLCLAVGLTGLGHVADLAAAAVGLPLAVALAAHALARFGSLAELSGPIGRLADLSRKAMTCLGVKDE